MLDKKQNAYETSLNLHKSYYFTDLFSLYYVYKHKTKSKNNT